MYLAEPFVGPKWAPPATGAAAAAPTGPKDSSLARAEPLAPRFVDILERERPVVAAAAQTLSCVCWL